MNLMLKLQCYEIIKCTSTGIQDIYTIACRH